jgi:hypothetical protein
MSRTCFVISPIGEEGSPERKHSDAVYRFIIKPAMKKCGIRAVRSDHLAKPGRISPQMFNEILSDDLCVAVLTGGNPNVYYELALAHAYGRPAIILVEKGKQLPFDVQDLRCVHYDLDPVPLFDKVYANEVAAHVKSLEDGGWQIDRPFGDVVASLGSDDDFRFVAKSGDFGGPGAWVELLEAAEKVIDLMGIGLYSWRKREGFEKIVEEKAAAGCQIRVLLMHEDNPALPALIKDDERALRETRREINWMLTSMAEFGKANDNVEVRQILTGAPTVYLVRTDQCAVCIPYFHSRHAGMPPDRPLLQCAPVHPLYATLEQEFSDLWQANEPRSGVRTQAATDGSQETNGNTWPRRSVVKQQAR